MDSKQVQNLRPPEVVTLAKARSKAAFAQAIGADVLLLRVDDPNGELVRGLHEASTAAGQRLEPTMGCDTVIGSLGESARNFSLAAHLARAPFGVADIQEKLLRSVHFAAPLRKRAGASNLFTRRISIGRARTNDIVLRHYSVSKFHAWFECDENEVFYVTDAKSTNATLVNGTLLTRGQMAIAPGDEVRFGDISATLCTPEILWDALGLKPAASAPPRRAP